MLNNQQAQTYVQPTMPFGMQNSGMSIDMIGAVASAVAQNIASKQNASANVHNVEVPKIADTHAEAIKKDDAIKIPGLNISELSNLHPNAILTTTTTTTVDTTGGKAKAEDVKESDATEQKTPLERFTDNADGSLDGSYFGMDNYFYDKNDGDN